MDESLTWKDFYGIEETADGYKVYDVNDWCYLATCDSYETAVITCQRYFDGLKKMWR